MANGRALGEGAAWRGALAGRAGASVSHATCDREVPAGQKATSFGGAGASARPWAWATCWCSPSTRAMRPKAQAESAAAGLRGGLPNGYRPPLGRSEGAAGRVAAGGGPEPLGVGPGARRRHRAAARGRVPPRAYRGAEADGYRRGRSEGEQAAAVAGFHAGILACTFAAEEGRAYDPAGIVLRLAEDPRQAAVADRLIPAEFAVRLGRLRARLWR